MSEQMNKASLLDAMRTGYTALEKTLAPLDEEQMTTPGVNGTGTLLGVVVKALAPGTTNLSIVQVNAKDSQQRPIPLVTSEATLRVQ